MARRGKINKLDPKDEIERPIRSRKYTYYILIVCEDENTEPYYFNQFKEMFLEILPKETVFLRSVGTGRNSLGVVEQAILHRKRLIEESGKEVDQTWAVFDKDDLDKTEGNVKNFIKAFELGKLEDINIAYSNECFELWLLLHFEDVDTESEIPRAELYRRLENAIKAKDTSFNYKHGDNNVIDFVREVGNEQDAIIRAQMLEKFHIAKKNTPISSNPTTLVYKLVKELREWLQYYNYPA